MTSRIHRITLKGALKGFADAIDTVPDEVNVYIPSDLGLERTAAYALLVSSVNERAKTSKIHDLFRALWDAHGDGVFGLRERDDRWLVPELKTLARAKKVGIWIDRSAAARCLREAASYVRRADMDLLKYAGTFSKPEEFGDDISRRVYRMGRGVGIRKKVRVYLRWTVRPAPDLNIFKHFRPSHLKMPLDTNVARAVYMLSKAEPGHAGLRELRFERKKKKLKLCTDNVEGVTAFARQIFPEDPLKLDRPLFLLGRSRLNSQGNSCKTLFQVCALGQLLQCSCPASSSSGFLVR